MTGPFIVVEGSDGSGKTTQFKLLTERLRAVGYGVDAFDFPRYDEPSAYFVKSYLNGEYGPASQINPYTASMFYALDRFAAASSIRETIEGGKVVLSNRFTGSNMAHQGSKFTSEAEQRGYFLWADSLEFQLLGIPRPVINIYLRVPADTAYGLIANKSARSYTEQKRDEHESDIEHLRKSVATYDLLCQLFPKDYLAIDCAPNGKLLSIAAINDLIWEAIQPYLSDDLKQSQPSERLVQLADTNPAPAEGAMVSGNAANITAGRRGQVLKSVSLLAARELSAGLGKVLALKPENGKNRQPGITPLDLGALTNRYQTVIKDLLDRRQAIVGKLKDLPVGSANASDIRYIEEALLPMAAKVSISFVSEAGNSKYLANQLAQKNLKEFLGVARMINPEPVKPQEAQIKVVDDPLTAFDSVEPSAVTRLDATPRAEISFLTDYLFAAQEGGATDLRDSMENWDYSEKQARLENYFSLVSLGRAIKPNLSYRFELLADDPTIRQMISSDCLSVESAQSISPKYGYEVPELLEKSLLDDDYIECFDISLKLYTDIQASGRAELSPYAVLAGHRSRWRASANYSQLVNLKSEAYSSRSAGAFKHIAAGILEAVAEVHPTFHKHLMSLKIQTPLQSTVPSASRTSKPMRNARRRQTAKKRK